MKEKSLFMTYAYDKINYVVGNNNLQQLNTTKSFRNEISKVFKKLLTMSKSSDKLRESLEGDEKQKNTMQIVEKMIFEN